jgi:hypothetical protein
MIYPLVGTCTLQEGWEGHRSTDPKGCHNSCMPQGAISILHPGETVIVALAGRSVKPTTELPSTLH